MAQSLNTNIINYGVFAFITYITIVILVSMYSSDIDIDDSDVILNRSPIDGSSDFESMFYYDAQKENGGMVKD